MKCRKCSQHLKNDALFGEVCGVKSETNQYPIKNLGDFGKFVQSYITRPIKIRRQSAIIKMTIFCFVLLLFSACSRLLWGDPIHAGEGLFMPILIPIIYVPLTVIIGGIGYILSKVPIIGKIIKWIIIVAIALVWIALFFWIIYDYGLIPSLFGIIVMIAIGGSIGTYTIVILIPL